MSETSPRITALSSSQTADSIARSPLEQLPLVFNDILDSIKTLLVNVAGMFSGLEAWQPEKRNFEDLIARTDEIRRRLAAPRLYAGVMGEICSGKSAFINAIAGVNLLPVDVLPGTTRMPVILANYPGHALFGIAGNGLARETGGNRTFRVKGAQDIFALADALLEHPQTGSMTAAQAANSLKSGSMPSECEAALVLAPLQWLDDTIALVDTPGLDSADENFSRRAEAIGEECDALLVLCAIEAPLSRYLMARVANICGGALQTCIFVGTHADALHGVELAKLERFFKNRLGAMPGYSPNFYFVSSHAAKNGKACPSSLPCLLPEAARTGILENLEKNRVCLKGIHACRAAQRVLQKLEDLAANAGARLCAREGQTAINGVEKDCGLLRQNFLDELAAAARSARELTTDIAAAEVEICATAINKKIKTFDDISRLGKYVEQELEMRLLAMHGEISKKVTAGAIRPLKEKAHEFARRLGEMTVAGNADALLELALEDDDGRYPLLRFTGMEELKNICSSANAGLWRGGGMAAGMIAAAMLPGIGWLAGGAIAAAGMFMGGSKALESERTNCLAKIDDYFARLRANIPMRAARHVDFIHERMKSALDMDIALIRRQMEVRARERRAACLDGIVAKIREYAECGHSLQKDIDLARTRFLELMR